MYAGIRYAGIRRRVEHCRSGSDVGALLLILGGEIDGGWMGFGQGQVQLFRAKMETLSVIPFPKRDRLNDNTTHTLPLSAPLPPPPSPPPTHH